MTTSTRLGARTLAALLPDPAELHRRSGPVYGTLAEAVSALVLDGRVPLGTRLPSERELAAALGVSRATITAAYRVLGERGFLRARTGSGSFVTIPATTRVHSSSARWAPPDEAGTLIDLTCAAPAGPSDEITAAVAAATGQLPLLTAGTGYDPVGLPRLRAVIAARYIARGVATSPEQIMITNGALHGLDLLLRLTVAPGDHVLTELPTYSGALDAIRASAARLLPVPLAGPSGWDVDAMRAALRRHTPALAYLIPDYQNPTGTLVPDSARRAVLGAARRTDTTVVVDETFVDVGFTAPLPPVASLDPAVITLGSLSKAVWGGLRIGWVRASAEIVQRLAALRAGSDMGGALFDQAVAAELIERLDELAAARRAEILPRRDALLAALARELPGWRARVPDGGLSLWVELDAPASTPLSVLARSAGVLLVPGSRFGEAGTLERFLRLPYTLPADLLDAAVARLADVWAQLDHSSAITRPLVVA